MHILLFHIHADLIPVLERGHLLAIAITFVWLIPPYHLGFDFKCNILSKAPQCPANPLVALLSANPNHNTVVPFCD